MNGTRQTGKLRHPRWLNTGGTCEMQAQVSWSSQPTNADSEKEAKSHHTNEDVGFDLSAVDSGVHTFDDGRGDPAQPRSPSQV